MAIKTLAERMNRLEQQKARLAEEEARLRDQNRKQRTRRLIEAGGLIEKAGLLDLDANALLGALRSLIEDAAKPEIVARWATEGGKVFAREIAERDRLRQPLTVGFPGPIAKELTGQLRALGLRWNNVLQHWEGMGDLDVVTKVAGGHGGSVRRVQGEPMAEAAE